MMLSARSWAYIKRVEGGFVNDPDDPGGATKYGVTQVEYDRWLKNRDMPHRAVERITETEAQVFYAERYWGPGHCSQLPWPINLAHFDACVNLGKPPAFVRSNKILQRAINDTGLDTLVIDGLVGAKTLAAVNMHPALNVLLDHYLWRRIEYYLTLRHRRVGKRFMATWLWRLYILREETQ